MLSGVMILLLGMALSSPVDCMKGKSCVQVFCYFYILYISVLLFNFFETLFRFSSNKVLHL